MDNQKPQIFLKPDGSRYTFSAQKGYGDRILTAIKEHGGLLVNNPRLADFILVHPSVNPKRGDVYYNWNLITDCCNANPPTFFTGDALERYRMAETGPLKGRSSFSKRDDELIREVLLSNKNVGGNVIWKQFADNHPESFHTWQSWRDRALKKIKPTLPKQVGGGVQPASASAESAPAPVPEIQETSTASGSRPRPTSPEITTSPMRTPPLKPTRTVVEHNPEPLPSPTSKRGRRKATIIVEDTGSSSDDAGPVTRAKAKDSGASKKRAKPANSAPERKVEATVEVVSVKRQR